MSRKPGPAHVVVDGSNLATEGRSLPSLAQLSEAVASFMQEHPETAVTVVVDATFGHRIDKKEVKEFEEGISNNELVAPPAGAVGRGDAFVLSIADKADATVLSNDSFQEFHGEYEWLFDEGRLIGGKPVPHVGWVWVDRIPVRGPVSRKATRGSGSAARSSSGGRSRSTSRRSSKAASEPMPVPKAPPPRAAAPVERPVDQPVVRPAPKAQEAVNALLPFLEFVEHHPIGTSVNGTVDAYSSHGAYITIGDEGVRGYVPLRLMSDPPPRSARKVMKLGESVTVVVASFAPSRRSIDCALPDMARSLPIDVSGAESGDAAGTAATRKRAAAKKTAAKKTAAKKTAAKKTPARKTAAKKTPARKTAAKKTASAASRDEQVGTDAAEAMVERPATKPARKTAAKKTAPKKSAAKKAAAKKTAAKKSATARSTAAKKSAARNAPAKQPARKRPAKKSATTASTTAGD